MYRTPRATITFGDVFDADWFYALYLRGDAAPLDPEDNTGLRWRRSRDVKRSHWRESQSIKGDHALSHGRRARAILLSDPCEIESVVDGRAGERLVMASIAPWTDQADNLLRERRIRDFRRHLLPPDSEMFSDGGVVYLGRLFAVAPECLRGRSAKKPEEYRLVALTDEAQVNLEVAWNAYAVRRGPLAVRDGARKLAALVTAGADSVALRALDDGPDTLPHEVQVAVDALQGALDIAWDLEGRRLNDVSDLHDKVRRDGADDTEVAAECDSIEHALAELAAASGRARDLLAAARGHGRENTESITA